MEKKNKIFNIIVLIITIILLVLAIIYNSAFYAGAMLMGALFLFGLCYYIKDKKKEIMYILFILGVLLIVGSLVYTYMRIN